MAVVMVDYTRTVCAFDDVDQAELPGFRAPDERLADDRDLNIWIAIAFGPEAGIC